MRGVYSATCSILNDDYSLNVDATIAHASSTINNGLHGAIFFGSTGQSQLISISVLFTSLLLWIKIMEIFDL